MENYTYLNYCMYDGANRSNGLPSLIAILVPLMTPLSPNGTCRDYWHIQATPSCRSPAIALLSLLALRADRAKLQYLGPLVHTPLL